MAQTLSFTPLRTRAGPSLSQDAFPPAVMVPLVSVLKDPLWVVRSPWAHLFVLFGLCLCPGGYDSYLVCDCAV